jgi:hypothetical protein
MTPRPMPRFDPSRRTLVAAAFFSAVALPARATRPIKVEGHTFAGDITLAGAALQLNGVGLRAIPMLKGYAAALYLPARATTPAQVLAMAGPKRLQLRMLLDVPTEEFVKAFHKGVERNTPAAEAKALAERMARFDATVRGLGKLRKTDMVDLDFVPGRGTQLALNAGARGAAIAGDDFYAALLRCFIGQRPADAEMKIGLLGGPVG